MATHGQLGLDERQAATIDTDRRQITVENAGEILHWLPEYRIIICSQHGYAIQGIANHLRIFHKTSKKERLAITELYSQYNVREAKDVLLPAPLQAPIEHLQRPRQAFICEEPECEYISISRDMLRKHCNRVHEWRATDGRREYWHRVWVQTFFTAGSERYFTVDYEEGEGRQVGSSLNTQEAVDVDEGELSGLLSDFSTLQEKWQKELEIADASVAKTDHTGWFNKNQWPEHLKNCNLRHLSRASRLPDRDEELFRKAVEINSALIERCVGGLSTLDNEIRRWLRSAKQSEPDVRPFARLQNPSSQERYANYFARLICYALRVLESEETRASREEESLISSDSDDNSSENNDSDSGSEDSSDSQQSNAHLQLSTDVLKDARRLFPWQGEQRDLLKKFRSALNVGAGEEATQDALLEFYRSIIFQRVRGDTFVSILLHYCAVLGIDGELFRLRRANDFSYMLAGLLYCIRVFAVEILLPSAERDKQGMDDDKRFRKERDEFLADGSLSVMSKMLSMLAYSKHIAMNHSNAGAVFWSDDRSVMTYKGNAIGLEQFSRFARDIVGEAEEKLWSDVLKTTKDERFSISLETLKDDVTFTKRGMSFINHKQNGLSNKQEWLLRRFVSEPSRWKLRMNGRWMKGEVRRYLRTIDRFRELLLLSIHICGGQPARGSEITAIRFRNGFTQDRNVFVVHGQVIVVTRYHKSQSQFDKPKVIPRFLP
jgi:hypothetical protein